MAYFDTGKTAGATVALAMGRVFDRVVKCVTAQAMTPSLRRRPSAEALIAARQRAEAHRRAVDRLMR